MENFEPLPLDLPLESDNIIKVIGVGGGGGNAVNHMFEQGIKDVSFVVCNTDVQVLRKSPVPMKLVLGELGAGGDPNKARDAAQEHIDEIREMLSDGTKMAFITAGMGGGTGTGAAPVVAQTAHELGILTVGIVTIPFAFEGPRKIRQALQGVANLSEHVDALLVINNEKLRQIYPELQMSNAFAKADDVLSNAAKAIAEIITVPGYINTDFADVYSTLKDGNVAIMNTGYAAGDERITNAIADALNSPLVNTTDVHGASKILLSLYCSTQNQIRMEEVEQIHRFMAQVGDNVDVIWGATFDDSLGDQVKITLIATGYDMSDIPGMPVRTEAYQPQATAKPAAATQPVAYAQPAQPVQQPVVSTPAPAPAKPVAQPAEAVDLDKMAQGLYGSPVRSKVELPVEDISEWNSDRKLADIENEPAWKRFQKK